MMTRRAPSGGKLFSLIDAMFICCVVATVFIVSSQHSTKYVAKYFEQAESIYEEHRFEDEEEELQTDLTELINTFLPLVSKLIVAYELDPLEISDVRQNYSIRFASLPVAYGVLTYSFSSGLLHHLSDLERVDTAIGTFRDNTLSIDASLEMDSMLMSYDYFVKVLFLRQYGTILAEANSILVNVRIDIDTIDCTFVLKKLKLHRIHSLAIFIRGSTLTERLFTPLTNVGISLANRALTEEIENRMTALLREYLEEITVDLPLWDTLKLFIAS